MEKNVTDRNEVAFIMNFSVCPFSEKKLDSFKSQTQIIQELTNGRFEKSSVQITLCTQAYKMVL